MWLADIPEQVTARLCFAPLSGVTRTLLISTVLWVAAEQDARSRVKISLVFLFIDVISFKIYFLNK